MSNNSSNDNKNKASTLSAADRKKSISGSKMPRRKVVINTLDTPFDIKWPNIGGEKEKDVRELLTRFLSPVRRGNVLIPKDMLKTIPKKDRKQWRKNESEIQNPDSEKQKQQRLYCCIGLRDVTKAVEDETAAVVICERNPGPAHLPRLLVPLCQTKSVPLVAIKQFTSTMSQVLQLPRCLALALKVTAQEASSPLQVLHAKLMDICSSSGLTISPLLAIPGQTSNINEPVGEILTSPAIRAIDCQRFYLKRSGQSRVFVPGNANPLSAVETADVDVQISKADDFISLDDDSSFQPPRQAMPRNSAWMAMRIKRLQSNDDESQKKLKTEEGNK